MGVDHDTSVCAFTSIESWWKHVSAKRDTRELYISADAGGRNGHRARLSKAELRRLSDELNIAIHVAISPGTSKWNKIEHPSVSFVSINRPAGAADLRDDHQHDQSR